MIDRKQIESTYKKIFFEEKNISHVPNNDEPFYFIQRYLPENHDSYILDAGCGDGRYMHKLATLGYKNVWGVDLFSPDSPKINNYICASIDKIPLADESVDMIYSLSTIYYLDKPIDAIKEFFRVLKPGTCLLITAHTKYSLFTLNRILRRKFKPHLVKHLKGVRFYSSLEYKKMMETAGFKVTEIDGYRVSYFSGPVLRKIFKLCGIQYIPKYSKQKRNKIIALLRSIFGYHAVLVGFKPNK
ncbi:MAG: methyltransferase domain-containing protein [Patescibacteria group bacterium]|jgi:ubiquinone/menaquinone biosynthesis C-methylase UbiE